MKGTRVITPYAPKFSTIRHDAIKTAKELGYNKDVIAKLEKAFNQSEINRILADARHEWDVDPGRWFHDRD